MAASNGHVKAFSLQTRLCKRGDLGENFARKYREESDSIGAETDKFTGNMHYYTHVYLPQRIPLFS
jgi:hypothetical protein